LQDATRIHKLRADLQRQVYAATCKKGSHPRSSNKAWIQSTPSVPTPADCWQLEQRRSGTKDVRRRSASPEVQNLLGKYSMNGRHRPPRLGNTGRRPTRTVRSVGVLLSRSVAAPFDVRALSGRSFRLTRAEESNWSNDPTFPAGTAGEPDFCLPHFPTISAQDVSKEESRWLRNR
jgi:hypothetical protein